jgi:putative ABC transport system permease protein
MADFWIDLKKGPRPELQVLMDVPGVAQWRERIQFAATVDLPDIDAPINARVVSLPDLREPVINDILLRRGNYFTDQRANEVIVSDAFARHHGLKPGDSVHLIINRRMQPLWIVGTAISSEFTYMIDTGSVIPDPGRFGVFYLKRSFAEDIYDMTGAANQVVGMMTPGGRRAEQLVLRTLEERLQEFGVFAAIPLRLQVSNQFLSNEIAGLGAFATVVPAIFLVTAAMVLNVFLGRIARQQRTIIGTLKALGYSDASIFQHYLAFGLLVGLIGGIGGSLLGYLASAGMTAVYRQYFQFPQLTSRIYPETHLIGISISLLFATVGSLRAAYAMLKLRPAAAMRPDAPRQGGPVWVERIAWLWSRFNSTWRMVVRNLIRARLRTWATAFSAGTGAALLTTGFMFVEAQNFLIDFQFHQISQSDIDVVFTTEHGRDALDELARAPGVRRVEPIYDLACTMIAGPYQRLGTITGLRLDAQLTTPRDLKGRPIVMPESGIVLSRTLAERLHISPGQSILIQPVRGERQRIPAIVARISDSYMGVSAYANIDYLSRLMSSSYVMTGAQLQVSSLNAPLRPLFAELKQTPGIQSIQARNEMIAALRETLLQNQFVFIGVLIVFPGAVYFGSILNSSFVSLQERRREVASLRALGYAPGQVGGVFLREAILTNIAGTVLGLPAGWALVHLTALSYDSEFLRLPVIITPRVVFLTVVIGFVFTLIAHAVVQHSIYKLSIRDALNVRE